VYYIDMNSMKRYNHTETEKRVERAHQRAAGVPLGDIKLAILIKHNAWLLSAMLDKALESHDINSVAYIAMMTLYSTPNNLANPSEICDATGETRSNMTRITDELVKKGLLKRITNEEDRRRVDLSLSDAGIELLRTVVPLVRECNASVFSVFNPQEKAVVEADMLKLKNALEESL
jgi:MarR family transcriptional repressor of emrRAB